MKSATFTAALLASVAVAKPHGHNRRHGHQHQDQLEKRELVVEWETVWETSTVYVDEIMTETVYPEETPAPEPTTSAGVPGQFFQTPTQQPTTLATSSPAPSVAPPEPSTQTPPPPAPTTTTTTTSTPAPQPTTTAAPSVAPAPPPVVPAPPPAAESTTEASPPAQSSSPPSSSSGGGGGGGGASGSGDITYYDVGLGACGYDDSGKGETENIVAMPKGMWLAVSSLTNSGLNSPSHPWCDKTITVTANGNSITATVRDQCPGCEGGSIDVTPHAFQALFGSLGGGRLHAEWTMN